MSSQGSTGKALGLGHLAQTLAQGQRLIDERAVLRVVRACADIPGHYPVAEAGLVRAQTVVRVTHRMDEGRLQISQELGDSCRHEHDVAVERIAGHREGRCGHRIVLHGAQARSDPGAAIAACAALPVPRTADDDRSRGGDRGDLLMRGEQPLDGVGIEQRIVVEPHVEVGRALEGLGPGAAHSTVPVEVAVAMQHLHVGMQLPHRLCRAVGASIVDEDDAMREAFRDRIGRQRGETRKGCLLAVVARHEDCDRPCRHAHLS